MKNGFHKKSWHTVAVQFHVQPSPINLIKSSNDTKLKKYFLEIKLCRDPKSEISYLYQFKIALFDNSEKEEILLFIWNFKMTLKNLRTLAAIEKIQYICTMLCVKWYVRSILCVLRW